MTNATTLTGATLPDGRVRDVVVRYGCVARIRPPGVPDPRHEVVDLSGYVLLPAPVEPHVHLDRALTWQFAGGDLGGRDGVARAWRVAPARYAANDLRRRGRATLRALSEHGVTAVRAQLGIGGLAGTSVRGFEVLRELREEFAPLLDLRIVVTPTPEVGERVVTEAFAAGAQVLGGSPHLVGDVRAGCLRLLRLADRVDADLDVHLDERPDPRVLAVGHLARLLRASGFGRRVTAGHLTGLALLRPPALARVAESVAASGMHCVVLPATRPAPGVNGVTRALAGAGVPVAASGDHVRPGVRADPLVTASLLVTRHGLAPEAAWAAVSARAREALGLAPAGPEEGAVADLLAVRAGSLARALAAPPADRVLFRRGRVADDRLMPRGAEPGRRVAVA